MAMKRSGIPPGYEVQEGGASAEGDYPGGEGWFHNPSKVPTIFYKTRQEAIDAAWREAYDFCTHCGAAIPPREGEGTCGFCDPEGVAKNRAKQK